MTHQPDRLVVVVGTATEVGKTFVSCRLLQAARARGIRVTARKPAQSFELPSTGQLVTDADLLAAATGERPHVVCPPHRWYEVPMAPPMAAAALGRPPILIEELIGELEWPRGVGIGVVETAGGVRSPLAEDGDGAELVARLQPDLVVLVADAGLGTINAVRSSMAAITDAVVVVVLNRFDADVDLHRLNAAWLADRDGFRVVTDPADVLGHPQLARTR
jgi:dethiobiotin synthetase